MDYQPPSGSGNIKIPQTGNAFAPRAVAILSILTHKETTMATQKGWEEVADFAVSWAVEHATRRPQMATTRGADSVYEIRSSTPGAEVSL
jgi:hypothetical protein